MSRLIQRVKIRYESVDAIPNAEITGFDSVFECLYMGSSEFEFGALPRSLREIVPSLDSYKIEQVKGLKASDGRGVFVFCMPDQRQDVNMVLKAMEVYPKWSEPRIFFKEHPGFADALNPTERYRYGKPPCVWWDIERNWFVCIGKPTAKLLRLALERLREKWAKKDANA